ncbi:hypothetical protein [Rhizobium sp.]
MVTLPDPEPGLVIHYNYLWRSEADAGRESGVKDRPCAVILALRRDKDKVTVVVAPITHSVPRDASVAIEVPPETKRRLGLDDAPSWLIADDLNYFLWPGPDLRPLPGATSPHRFAYGYLSNAITHTAIAKVRELMRAGRTKPSGRTE